MKRLKFRIRDENQSKRLQKVLFKLGYEWAGGGKKIKNTNKPFLFLNTYLDYSITYCYEIEHFLNSNNEEINTEIFIKQKSETKLSVFKGKIIK
jgi:hypothetical protein